MGIFAISDKAVEYMTTAEYGLRWTGKPAGLKWLAITIMKGGIILKRYIAVASMIFLIGYAIAGDLLHPQEARSKNMPTLFKEFRYGMSKDTVKRLYRHPVHDSDNMLVGLEKNYSFAGISWNVGFNFINDQLISVVLLHDKPRIYYVDQVASVLNKGNFIPIQLAIDSGKSTDLFSDKENFGKKLKELLKKKLEQKVFYFFDEIIVMDYGENASSYQDFIDAIPDDAREIKIVIANLPGGALVMSVIFDMPKQTKKILAEVNSLLHEDF